MFFVWRCLTISSLEHQINEDIRDKEVRLIDADGNQVGIVPIAKALDAAAAKNLDLVKIAPQAQPPVCRVMDYGKFRFEQSKREKEARKKQHIVEIKEIRLSPGIDSNDFQVKANHAKRFLKGATRSRFPFASADVRSPTLPLVWICCTASLTSVLNSAA